MEDLLRSADTAMHALKARGGDGWQFFNAGLQEEASRRMAILSGLRNAIQQQEFRLVYQPIVRLEDRCVVGAEALLRWTPPQGSVSPAVFIPVAELSGLIVPIGAWCFREACRASAAWNRALGEAAPLISVNLSTRQLSDEHIPQRFAQSIRETGADPTRIQLEITETSLMADVSANMRVIRQLTALGLSLAIDDFGTGYSSLAYLIRLPVSTLKIDKVFIDGIALQAESQKVVRTIIHLGRSLNLKLVAEGVETERQLAILGELGCDRIQGYIFSRPLEADALEPFILEHLPL